MPATRPRAYQVYDIDWKQSVKAVSVSNINVTSPGSPLMIDGVGIAPFDRILLVGQTDLTQNGVWQLNATGSALTRGVDFQNDGTGLRPTVESGVTITVEQGSAYAFSIWELATPNPIQLGTTALTFRQQNNFLGRGSRLANGQYVGGAVQLSLQPGNRKTSSDNFYVDLTGESGNGNLVFSDGNINILYGANTGGARGGLTVEGDITAGGEIIVRGNTFANVVGNLSGYIFANSIMPIDWDGTQAGADAITLSNLTVDIGNTDYYFRDVYAGNFWTPAGTVGTNPAQISSDPSVAAGQAGVAFTDAVSGDPASVNAGAASLLNTTIDGTLQVNLDGGGGGGEITAATSVEAPLLIATTEVDSPLVTVTDLDVTNFNFANGTRRRYVERIDVVGGLNKTDTIVAPGVVDTIIELPTTGVTAGTYAPHIAGNPANTRTSAEFTVDAYGRITAAQTYTVTPAFSSITDTPTTLAGYGITDAVNVVRLANAQIGDQPGVATLDITGKIPVTQLPSIAISNTYVVNTYQDLTTLSSAELGDVGIVVNDPDIYRITSNLSLANATTINFTSVANIEVEQQVLRVANGVQIFGFGTTVTNVDVGNNTVTFSQGLLANVGASANVQFISFYDDTSWILANAAPGGYADINNWVQLRFPVPVISVNGKTGAVVLTPDDVGAAANTRQIIAANGLSGGGNLRQDVTVGLANLAATGMLTPGTYGNTSYVPVITVDQYGRIGNVELAPVDQTLAIVFAVALG